MIKKIRYENCSLYFKYCSMDLRVAGRWRLGRKVGSGSFGDIYQGTNLESGEPVAIKLEPLKSRHPQLLYESRIYKILHHNTSSVTAHPVGPVGIPEVKWYGTEGDYTVMIIDLLGPSLEDLFSFCGRKFSLKTTLMLADQILARMEYIHAKSFLHRDIKPDNFLMGTGKRGHIVYIIDFGLAKKYRDPRTNQHIPYREGKNLTGTARYCSLYTHLGAEQSRRDDLEAVGYILLYFLRGSLPWQGLKATTKQEKYDRISEKKMSTSVDSLCKGYPPELAVYMNYCRALRFEDKPDYSYLRKLFRDLFTKEGYETDYVFDWTVKRIQESLTASPVLETDRAGKIESTAEKKESKVNFVCGSHEDDAKSPGRKPENCRVVAGDNRGAMRKVTEAKSLSRGTDLTRSAPLCSTSAQPLNRGTGAADYVKKGSSHIESASFNTK